MQTKLRMLGMLSLTFVAGLLWTSALAAAPAPKQAFIQERIRRQAAVCRCGFLVREAAPGPQDGQRQAL